MLGAILAYISYSVVEAAILGVFALSVSRKSKGQYDTGKAVLIIIMVLILQMVLVIPLLNYADLKINNKALINLLGTANLKDLVGFDIIGIIMNLVEAVLGIFIGKKILNSFSH